MDDPLSQLQDTPADDDSLETNDLILMKKVGVQAQPRACDSLDGQGHLAR